MGIRYFIIFLSFIVSTLGFSQDDHVYVGGIKLNDTTIISYKINFQVLGSMVKGYSITDLGGEHETRSSIYGEYDWGNKELSFRETYIVYTKSPVSQNDFCFLNVTVKKFVPNKTNTIKTNFIGLFSDHTTCIDGELLLTAKERIESRIDKVVNKLGKTKKIPDSIKQNLNLHKMMDSLQMNVLKQNEVLSMFSSAKRIKFTVYDGGKADGDRISIVVNDKQILSNYEAIKAKKTFYIELDKNKTNIIIKALNEGSIVPNTVFVEIQDDNNTIKALSNLKKGESTQLDIIKHRKS